MRRIATALAVLVLAGGLAHAELRVTQVEATYNPVWPGWSKLEYYTNDLVFLRFLVTGAKRNARGEVDYRVAVRLTDKDGKEVAVCKMLRRQLWLALGGDGFVSFAGLPLDGQVPPGEYRASLTVQDEVSGDEASVQRPLAVKPLELAVVAPTFSYDPEGRVPAPPGGDTTRTLYWRLNVIGFACPGGEVDMDARIEVLDTAGHRHLSSPEEIPIRREARDGSPEPNLMHVDGSLPLSLPGDFLLRVTFADRKGHKTARFETPLHVSPPRKDG